MLDQKNISNENKVKCLFGYHNYTVPNKDHPDILICGVCKRFGYRKWSSGLEVWYGYDERGNEIYCKYPSGLEIWYEYDEKENMIHCKYSSGFEEWWDGSKWVKEKPKNWKYEVKCLFGHHNYTIPDKNNPNILICSVCKRFGYRKYSDGYKMWYEYNEKGKKIHCKDSDGYEIWYRYDEKGNRIHCKYSSGFEEWFDGKEWKSRKPKNWKYEKHIK